MIGIGDSRDDRLQRLDVLLARHGDSARCRRRPRRRGGSGPSSPRGSPSPSWSSSARRRARRRRSGTPPTWICRSEAMALHSYEPGRIACALRGAPTSTQPRAGRWRASPPRSPRAPARRRHARFFALTGLRAGRRASSTSAAARSACARCEPEPRHHRRRPRRRGPATPARSCGRRHASGLPFADGEFDLVYSLERDRARGARAARRVRRRAAARRRAAGTCRRRRYSFPVEPHALLPFAHWLPVAPAPAPTGGSGAAGDWEEIALLRRGELEALFGARRAPSASGRWSRAGSPSRRRCRTAEASRPPRPRIVNPGEPVPDPRPCPSCTPCAPPWRAPARSAPRCTRTSPRSWTASPRRSPGPWATGRSRSTCTARACDDFAVAVAGGHAARAALEGKVSTWEAWAPFLTPAFERRGAHGVPRRGRRGHRARPADPRPVSAASPGAPGGWDPADLLVVVLRHANGDVLGILGVDEPAGGRRPGDDARSSDLVTLGPHGRAGRRARAARAAGPRRTAPRCSGCWRSRRARRSRPPRARRGPRRRLHGHPRRGGVREASRCCWPSPAGLLRPAAAARAGPCTTRSSPTCAHARPARAAALRSSTSARAAPAGARGRRGDSSSSTAPAHRSGTQRPRPVRVAAPLAARPAARRRRRAARRDLGRRPRRPACSPAPSSCRRCACSPTTPHAPWAPRPLPASPARSAPTTTR